jgi:D-arabinose 1-dehydrogenase-like Zn-dependent alcohol dehydrogenase
VRIVWRAAMRQIERFAPGFGLPPGEFPTPIFDVVLKRLTIRGSIVGTRKDLQEALQFAAEGC